MRFVAAAAAAAAALFPFNSVPISRVWTHFAHLPNRLPFSFPAPNYSLFNLVFRSSLSRCSATCACFSWRRKSDCSRRTFCTGSAGCKSNSSSCSQSPMRPVQPQPKLARRRPRKDMTSKRWATSNLGT